MAINKNFVIKNGIQVNENLIVADPVNNFVGINTALPEYGLQVIGGIGVTQARITGVTTSLGDLLVGTDGTALAVKVSAGNSVGIGTNLPLYPLHVRGPASSGSIAGYIYGDLEVTGDFSSANFSSGSANFSGITTFTNATNNTLGNPNTGAVQIDGGLGINKNVTVGGGLSVTGNSYFVGMVTFAAGASGTIQLGDNANDNVEFQADVNSNIIPNTTSTFNLGSSSQEWRDLHLAGNAGIGSLAITGISTFNDNVKISSLTENRIPIVGAGSTIEDDANLTFDGSRLAVGVALTVSGISTFSGNIDANGNLDVDGHTELDDLNVTGISTFGNNVKISSLTENRIPIVGAGSTIEDDANLTFDGSQLIVGVGATVGGALTVTGNVDLNADLDVDGRTDLDDLVVTGVSTFVGVSSFTNTTDNTLGDVNTGAIKVDGGMGIAGNVTVGGGLSVTGNSYFVGMVTFAAGTDGNITLGDSNTDNVIFNADVNSNIIPNTNDAYNLGSGTQQWKDFFATGNAGIGSLSVAGVSTFSGDINIGTGATVGFGSTAYFKDNAKAIFGDGEDLEIYHDGNHSYIDETGTGNLKLRTNNFKISNNDESKTSIIATPPEGVELYYDGTKRFATSGVGVTVYNDLKVEDNTESNSLNIVGVSTFGGIATFTDTTQNPLGSTDTAAVKIAGGLAVAKNVTVGGGLSVTGNSYFVGMVTFAAGTNGTIQLGDTATDNVVFNADVNSNLIPNTNGAYDLGSSSQKWADLYLTGNAGVGSVHVAGVSTFVGIATFNNGIVIHSGISTFHTTVDINGNLDVDGHTELDDLNVSGIATFTQTEFSNINVTGVTTTKTLHVGSAGTVLSVDADNSTFAIGSASNPVTATMNGGAIPSIGLVIALGS